MRPEPKPPTDPAPARSPSPAAAPATAPGAAPNAVPDAALGAAPAATPTAAPHAAPDAAPGAAPNAVPDATPGAHDHRGWRRLALLPAALLLQLWGRSLRFEISEEHRRNLEKGDEPVAFILWHNRLFITAEIIRRYRHGRPLHALVSASRDGAWLHTFFNACGVRTVRGSSSRLGREAATALVGVLRAGNDVGITPDGPRGPVYVLKPGALVVARRTRVPVMLFSAEFTAAWRLRSWDGFYIPRPWSRVRLACLHVAPEELDDRTEAAASLQARLLAISPDRIPMPERRRRQKDGLTVTDDPGSAT